MIYYIPNKKHTNLINFIKPHVAPGSIMLSDEHSAYVATSNGLRSKLAFYGYYHYWINHSRFYVHEKFNFVNTSRIESTWNDIRHVHNALKMQMDGVKIQEYCDSYSIRKITKSQKQYQFVYRAMYYYYIDLYHEYLELQAMRDDYWPNIEQIDRCNRMLRIKSVANSNRKEDGRQNVVGKDDTLKSRFNLMALPNFDLYDCVRPINEYDMDYSILSAYHAIKRRREKKVLNLRVYIPVSKELCEVEPFDYDLADRNKLANGDAENDDEAFAFKRLEFTPRAIAAGASHHQSFRDYDISSMKFNKSYRDYLRKLKRYGKYLLKTSED